VNQGRAGKRDLPEVGLRRRTKKSTRVQTRIVNRINRADLGVRVRGRVFSRLSSVPGSFPSALAPHRAISNLSGSFLEEG